MPSRRERYSARMPRSLSLKILGAYLVAAIALNTFHVVRGSGSTAVLSAQVALIAVVAVAHSTVMPARRISAARVNCRSGSLSTRNTPRGNGEACG